MSATPQLFRTPPMAKAAVRKTSSFRLTDLRSWSPKRPRPGRNIRAVPAMTVRVPLIPWKSSVAQRSTMHTMNTRQPFSRRVRGAFGAGGRSAGLHRYPHSSRRNTRANSTRASKRSTAVGTDI